MSRPVTSVLGSLVVGLPILACGGDSTAPQPPPPPPAIAGTYALASIEGLELPAILDSLTSNEDIPPAPIELGCELLVTDGELDIDGDGTYTRSETTVEGDCDDPADDQPPVTNTWSGTWTLVGDQLSVEGFGSASSTMAEGTFQGDEISLTYVTGLFGQVDTVRVFRR